MTEFNETDVEAVFYWDELIGERLPFDEVSEELQMDPGLVVLSLKDGALCPEAQFRPDTHNRELVPELAEAWRFARERYGIYDVSGLITFQLFKTPQAVWGERSYWDVLVSEDGAKHLDEIKDYIVDALPKQD